MGERIREIQPLNPKAKDTFFKKVYESPERLKRLAEFLLGAQCTQVDVRNLRPVLYGTKENDLAFSCEEQLYVMMEEQSSICYNLPFRCTEYMVAMLREAVDTEKLLYGKKRVMLPMPKIYGLNVGIVRSKEELSAHVTYEMRLSDSFLEWEKLTGEGKIPDLEAVVHMYDFRMTAEETYRFLKENLLPERLRKYGGDLLDYALTANSLTYVQKARKEEKKQYPLPEKINSPAELFQVLIERGIFVDLLTNKEVCDMTVAQFSRDEMLLYQGREEGEENGIHLTKSVMRLNAEGYAVSDIAARLQISEDKVRMILAD